MQQPVICTAAAGVEPALRDAVCDGFLSQLRLVYPGQDFALSQAADQGGPGLELRITAANKNATAIQLIWTAADGSRLTGTVETVSAMDRGVS